MNDAIDTGMERLGETAAELAIRGECRDLDRGGNEEFELPVAKALSDLTPQQLDEVIRARESVREFSSRPLPREALADICQAAAEVDDSLFPQGTPPVWLVRARRVSDLAPAYYSFRSGGFVRLAAAEPGRGALQEDIADAPAVCTPLFDLAAELTRSGPDGYFNALVRAGYGLHSAWLTAVRTGVSGCLFRGPDPVALHAAVGLGRVTSRPLLALALGYAQHPVHG